MSNVTVMDINGSNNVEVSVRMKMYKATYKVHSNSLKNTTSSSKDSTTHICTLVNGKS